MKKCFFAMIFCLFGTTLFAQSDFIGTWNTGEQNTLIKIHEVDSEYIGEIISSENPEAKIGATIIKDFKLDGDTWECQLFAAKRKKWVDAEIEYSEGKLKISVSKGFRSKTIEWEKVETKSEENDSSKTE
jgi:hypothetical protein